MYTEEASPFDVALSGPLLQEPVKKKWSLLSKPASWLTSSRKSKQPHQGAMNFADEEELTVSFVSPTKTSSSPSKMSVPPMTAFRRASSDTLPTAPLEAEDLSDEFSCTSSSIEDIPLGSDDPLAPLRSSTKSSTGTIKSKTTTSPTSKKMLPMEISLQKHAFDLDTAILRERETEFANVAGFMRQIRDIQQDLALVVESQSEDIDRLSMNAIEAFDRAESGMEHLVRAVGHQHGRSQTQNRMVSVAAVAAVVMAIGFIASTFFQIEEMEPSSDSSSGSPAFMMSHLIKLIDGMEEDADGFP